MGLRKRLTLHWQPSLEDWSLAWRSMVIKDRRLAFDFLLFHLLRCLQKSNRWSAQQTAAVAALAKSI